MTQIQAGQWLLPRASMDRGSQCAGRVVDLVRSDSVHGVHIILQLVGIKHLALIIGRLIHLHLTGTRLHHQRDANTFIPCGGSIGAWLSCWTRCAAGS